MSCYCQHIMNVKDGLDASVPLSHLGASMQQQCARPLELNPHLLDEMTLPATVRENLRLMTSRGTNLIQRVSEETYLVRSVELTQAQPLGLLHVRFSKSKTLNSAPPTFYCPCTAYKRLSSAQSSGAPTTPRISKRCLHFYLCLWAFASSDKLSEEYACFHLCQKSQAGCQGKNEAGGLAVKAFDC